MHLKVMGVLAKNLMIAEVEILNAQICQKIALIIP